MTNAIGIDEKTATELSVKLNALLAHYSIFYQNTRGYHWNIQGRKFFQLHDKFEELYDDLFEKIDDVAERILTLGYSPEINYSAYIKLSAIKEGSLVSDGIEAVEDVIDSLKTIIELQREILALATDAHDEGTSALMSDHIRIQEKQVWMYSSFLKE